jgi:D-3-phosphoglycerate dehydrogenase
LQKQIIVWLDIHDQRLMELEDEHLPKGFVMLRPKSRTDRQEHIELLKIADYIISGTIPTPKEYVDAMNNVKMIQKWGIGVDRVDIEAVKAKNIPIYITAGANAVPVAELALGLILSLYRKIPLIDQSVRRGEWVRQKVRAECFTISGKTVGLLGFGSIARELAAMLSGFKNVRIIYNKNNRLSKDEEAELGVEYVRLEELLQQSDILSVHIPLNEKNRNIISKQELESMKSSAILINTSRGGIVNEADLAEALSSGIIAGAGIDNFEQEPPPADHPFFTLSNTVLTCHCGSGVADNVLPVTLHAYRNIVAHSKGEPIDAEDRFC